MSYNGWTNYATWSFKLWLDNDEGSYHYWTERAQDAYNNAEAEEYMTREQVAARELSEELKDNAEEEAYTAVPNASWLQDVLTSAVKSINFREIADHYIDDVETEEVGDE